MRIDEQVNKVISVNEVELRTQISTLVKGSVEETLNALLDAEAERFCNAGRYERSEHRQDSRAGYYERELQTKAGKVKLKVPKLRYGLFETAIIERYQRRESSVEEALVEMYLAGVSTRRVEDITQALWGSRVSASTVSHLNQKVFAHIEEWRQRPLQERYVYLYVDGIVLKKCFAGEVRHISLLIAMGVNEDGYREVLGITEGLQEDGHSWREFLASLRGRGLKTFQLMISDAHQGMLQAMAEVYPHSRWQRCLVHFYRNILAKVGAKHRKEVALMLKAIHNQESRYEAMEKAKRVGQKLTQLKLEMAAKHLLEHIGNTLTFYDYQETHWRRIRTNNPLERLMREVRRRTRVVGAFPDGNAALNLAAARLRYLTGQWKDQAYLSMENVTHE